MRMAISKKFAIPISDMEKLLTELSRIGAKPIMAQELLTRTLFTEEPKGKRKQANQKKQQRWLRVRQGDIDQDGNRQDTLTLKVVESAFGEEKIERTIDLKIDSIEKCIELLTEIGLKKYSVQENYRTKFVCNRMDEHFVVNIDTWPWIEDTIFVTIKPAEAAIDPASLKSFCERIGFTNGQEGIEPAGVDQWYEQKLGFSLGSVRDVRFSKKPPVVQSTVKK